MKKRRIGAGFMALLLAACTALALSSGLIWPQADGKHVLRDGKLTVDTGGAENGYIMARGASASKRYKLRVQHGDVTLTYDLNSRGDYEVFPLQFGSGAYTVSLYLNSSGKKYSAAGTVKLSASVEDPNAPFLVPNQYVSYGPSSRAVQLSEEICGEKSGDRAKFEAVRAYIARNFLYDYIKAVTVQPGTMPDIDGCVDARTGICQDLAAMAACMLRVQGIPTKLVIGYVGKQYHAWNVVLLDGKEILYDPTAELGGISGGTYSAERFY